MGKESNACKSKDGDECCVVLMEFDPCKSENEKVMSLLMLFSLL